MNRDLEAGERTATDPPGPTSQLPPGSTQFAVETSPASPPTVEDTQARRGKQEDRLARYYEPCPQGQDCAGDGKHRRLATGKALIDCAVAGYNHADTDIRRACAANASDPAFDPTEFYIAQTREAQQAIESARQAQIACVEAFEGYAVAKLAKDKTVSVADKQAAVEKYMAQLPELFQAVKGLIGTKIGGSGDRIIGPSVEVDTIHDSGAVIVSIRELRAFPRPLNPHWVSRSPDEPISRSTDFEREVLRGE